MIIKHLKKKMNQNNIFINPQNSQLLKPKEINAFQQSNTITSDNKKINQNQTVNFPFKIMQKEKETNFLNNILLFNAEKENKNSDKNIPVVKPKFITKTIPNEEKKIKCTEEIHNNSNPSLNLTNSNSSAFQPKIIKDQKDFIAKVNNKLYNLIIDTKNEIFKIQLHELRENIYTLKYYYENNFSLADLKALNKFFRLFDNVTDMIKELEKWLNKNKYSVIEDVENKISKVIIKVPIFQCFESIELTLLQNAYSKENIFELLCKRVGNMQREYGKKIFNLEEDNKYLMMSILYLMNTINPMNMNKSLNQRENNRNNMNINNNNNNKNPYNNQNNIDRVFNYDNNINNMNNKNLLLNKNIQINDNNNEDNNINQNVKIISNNNKYKDNKENNISDEDEVDISFDTNSNIESNLYDEKTEKNQRLKLKRKRERKSSNSSNKNNSDEEKNIKNDDKNNNKEIMDNDNNNNSNNMNYYTLADIKANKLNKIKGLYDIIQSNEELYMIINKILFKYYKFKKPNIINYESRLHFCLLNLFDSSIHGDSASEFHNLCDYRYNTITLLETPSGHRFGGYTSECFESPKSYVDKKDNLSFVFSLDKMKTYDIIRGNYAISCDKKYGPYFRDDHICIVDNFFSEESGTCIKGKGFNTTKNYELNFGKKYFTVKRLQVFQIKIKTIK